MIANLFYFGFAGIIAVTGVGAIFGGVRLRIVPLTIFGAVVMLGSIPLFALAVYMATCREPCLP